MGKIKGLAEDVVITIYESKHREAFINEELTILDKLDNCQNISDLKLFIKDYIINKGNNDD